jgi:hypothetical protein
MVGDLKGLDSSQRAELLAPPDGAGKGRAAKNRSKVKRMNRTSLQEILRICDQALPGAADYRTDYRKGYPPEGCSEESNPYKAKHGKDGADWKKVLRESYYMRKWMDVRELWEMFMTEAATVMKGTKHEKDWLIDHDALIQLTNDRTIEWMKNKVDGDGVTYYDRWLLPQHGLNDGTAFAGRPVGNHPEHMPPDSTLNKDEDDCVHYQVVLTDHLKDDDPRKFRCDTPTHQDWAYARCHDPQHFPGGSMPSHRIIEDCEKCYGENLTIICLADGWAVQGCGTRDGHRRDESFFGPPEVRERMLQHVPRKFGWGGKRTKRTEPEKPQWVHPDATAARTDWLCACKRAYHGMEVNEHAMDMDERTKKDASWMRCV